MYIYVLRGAKKMIPGKISGFSSTNGTVQVWVKPPNPSAVGARNTRTILDTHSALEEFCTKLLEVSLTTFIEK